MITRKERVKSIPPSDFYRFELPSMPSPTGGGWCNAGLCPFHDDRKAGSFWVNVDTGAFVCFSCSTKGGDVISFTQQRDSLSFPDAVSKLAKEWGV